MAFRLPLHPSLCHARTFTSSNTLCAKSTKQRLAFEHAAVPPYPYGPSQVYKQSNFGLYGLQKIRFGNIVSKKNEIKTRRHWRPNVHFKRLWSDSLGTYIRLRITARVLRTVDKCGGLDEYLLGEKARRIKELGMGGWKLRWRIMQTDKVKERFRKQREALGLPPLEDSAGLGLNTISKADELEAITQIDEALAKGAELTLGEVEEGDMLEEDVMEEDFMEEKSPDGKIIV
jgi:large subunit ribosomal protein L28